MLYKLTSSHDQYPLQKLSQKLALAFTGVISFTVDTIGVGSFAIDISIAKTLKLVKDNELPGFVNGAQVIPGTIEAVFFGALHVDFITLVVLVIGATVGGFIGEIFASKIHTATIRLVMIVAFILMILLLVGKLLEILPIGGSSVKLNGINLY
ncbi:hypothetical protein AS144_03605 [Francisella endosymbiont of Amblyomma maculatum]|nr:hypothetical protein AS144_03605 [Francisella endosymbiont of Amblyomma maculatum]